MIVEHDLYEDDDDDFACGRAFGASRICTVSTARYNPSLDILIGLDRSHAWPASHCQTYIGEICGVTGDDSTMSSLAISADNPLQAAVTAFSHYSEHSTEILWLERVCRTASHELGHCFGMEHCGFYACMMQGTSSIAEDVRQPPYLCPIDSAEVLHALDCDGNARDKAILDVCSKFGSSGGMFTAYAAWLQAVRSKSKQSRSNPRKRSKIED